MICVFAVCILTNAHELEPPQLLEMHERLRDVIAPASLLHVHPDEVTWSIQSPDHALSLGMTLALAIPEIRIAMDVGEAVLHAPDTAHPMGWASRRASTLAHAAGEPGLFAGASFVDATPGAHWGVADEPGVSRLLPQRVTATSVVARWEMCASLIERAMTEIERGAGADALLELHQEQASVLAMMRERAELDPSASARSLVLLSGWAHPIWMRPEAIELSEHLASPGLLTDPELREEVSLLLAIQQRKTGRFEASIARLKELRHAAAAPRVRANAWSELGDAYAMQEAFESARSCYEEAMALAREHHVGAVLARTYRALAVLECARAIARSPETDALVFDLLDRSLQHAQEVEDWQEKLRTLGEMSNILSAPEPQRSKRLALQCTKMARALMLSHFLSPTLAILTRLALTRARLKEARVHLDAARLAASQASGENLTLMFSEALVCLHESDIEQVDALLVELRRLAEQGSSLLAAQLEKLELLVSIASGRKERFWSLHDGKHGSSTFHRAAFLLGEATFLEGVARARAIDALVEAARATDGPHTDGFSAIFWAMALQGFPHELLGLCNEATLVVNLEEGWFMKADTGCVELSHRPYLKRFLEALVARHEDVEVSGFGTLELFRIGWPGTSIQTSAMKNRVYVGVSVLRDLGLREWLLNDASGYRLDRDVTIFHSQAPAQPEWIRPGTQTPS